MGKVRGEGFPQGMDPKEELEHTRESLSPSLVDTQAFPIPLSLFLVFPLSSPESTSNSASMDVMDQVVFVLHPTKRSLIGTLVFHFLGFCGSFLK